MLSLFLSGVLASTHTHSPSFPLLQQIFFSFSFTAIVEEEPPTETVSSWHLGSHIAPSVLLLPAPIHKRDLHPRHHSCRWRCLQFTAKSCLRTPRRANNHEYDLVFKVLCVNKPGLSVFSRLMSLFFVLWSRRGSGHLCLCVKPHWCPCRRRCNLDYVFSAKAATKSRVACAWKNTTKSMASPRSSMTQFVCVKKIASWHDSMTQSVSQKLLPDMIIWKNVRYVD